MPPTRRAGWRTTRCSTGTPAAIVRPTGALEVARAVVAARELGLDIAVRGGGHSLAGHSTIDGGLLIDLSAMRDIEIDPVRWTGTAQGGATAGEYTTAAARHGFATPFGDTGSVGLGGLTLGGGIGWLARKHGMTIDSLLSVDLVTADGELRTVSEASDPDLFWAVRGGGGNFGIATRFQYRLHPVSMVVGGMLALPLSERVLLDVIDASMEAPEELTQISMIMNLPPMPFVPAEFHGVPALVVMPVYAGDLEAGQAAMAPFRSIAKPIADMVGPMPYPGMYQLTAGAEAPSAEVVRSAFLGGLDVAAAEALVDHHRSPEGARDDDPAAGPRRRDGPGPGRRHRVRPSRVPGDGRGHGRRPEHPRGGRGARERAAGRDLAARRPACTRTSSARRARPACTTPTRGRRTSGSSRSSGGSTRRTCSTPTRTSSREPSLPAGPAPPVVRPPGAPPCPRARPPGHGLGNATSPDVHPP